MDRKYIVQFLEARQRGVYPLIVNIYADVLGSMSVRMAIKLIADDLEKETGARVRLNYYSLAKATAKLKKNGSNSGKNGVNKKWDFKDAHELKEDQVTPGRFSLKQ